MTENLDVVGATLMSVILLLSPFEVMFLPALHTVVY